MSDTSYQNEERFRKNKYNEEYLYSINRRTFENEKSTHLYNIHFDQKLKDKESLYIILGTDSGLLVKYIMEQDLPQNTRYLFIEPLHVLEKITSFLPDDYDKSTFAFTTPEGWELAAGELEVNIYIYKDNIHYIKSFAAIDAYIPEYQTANVSIVKAYDVLMFFTRAMVDVYPFMTKQLMNISENRYSSTLLKDRFKGKTCIILGGGPSLDEDLAWIKENQQNIVIFAVSRIARTLLKHNLTPHIIVSVDPYDMSFDVSKELLRLPKEVLFLNANCVHPSLLAQWHGRSIAIGARFPWNEKSDENCSIMGGPTVTNTALKAAIEMGCSNILLSGVDLCYAKSGVSYASDSNEAKIGPTIGEPGLLVETYAGHMAETLIEYDNAVIQLSQQALAAQSQGVAIYNLSKNAAKAEHIAHIPTAALSFENEEKNIWQIIDENVPKPTVENIQQDNNLILSKVSKMLNDVQAVSRLAHESLQCNEKLFQEKGEESKNFKFKLRMDKIEKKIDTKYSKASNFIKNFGLDKFISSAHTSHDDWSNDKIEETGRCYYQAYIDSSAKLIEELKVTIQRIKSRINEEKSPVNFPLLCKQWQEDKHYGRAAVWVESIQRLEIAESIKEQDLYLSQIAAFNDVINSENTPQIERAKYHASLDKVKRKIIGLFHQHNVEGLHVIATSLNLYDESNKQARELYLLATAYGHATSKDPEQALAFFELLPPDVISEDELQQMTSLAIKLKLYSKAEIYLQSLAGIANVYAPQYAKLLKLNGKTKQAIDTYTHYLSENKDDTNTWLLLGKLYFELEAYNSAKIAFMHIISQDPTNTVALEYLESSLL